MERGSPKAEVLLAELDWVRQLAGALVRDPALADDVAQDAWLAALSSAGPRGSAPRAWLAAVTRNAARLRARREQRRRDLEPAAARAEPLPSTDVLAERAAVHKNLVDHVLALPDPYRRALLLRYFEGLAPADIAEREGVPAATVKTRLRRGLERLRERLDAAHGGRRAWAALLAPLVPEAGALVAGVGVMLMAAKVVVGGAAAAAVVGLGAWLWQGSRGASAGAEPPAGAPAAVALAPAAEPAPLAAAGHEQVRTAVAAAEPAPATAPDALAVRVVADATGAPVPGAEVYSLGAADFRARALAAGEAARSDPAALVLAAGARSTSDAQGVARIPPGAANEPVIVAGRAEGLFGFGDVRPGAATPELRLARDRTLRFRTVDRAGAPLPGVPVGVRLGPPGGPADWIVATAGAEAQGALPHFDALLGPALRKGATPALVLPFPLAEPVGVALDDAALEGVVTLSVPPTGALAVDAPGGEPLAGPDLVLRIMSGELEVGLWRGEPAAPQFPRVGLGLALRLELVPRGASRALATLDLAGPMQAGELVRVELQRPQAGPVLAGTAVQPDGAPVAGRRGVLTWSGAPPIPHELTTDERGAFRVDAPAEPPRGLLLRFPALRPGEEELRAPIVLALPLAPGTTDLGTLVASPPPVAARGRVVASDGTAVSGASVLVLRGPERGGRWVPASGVQTSADGTFALPGPLDEPCELLASKSGFLCADRVPLRAGAADHELVLTPEARLAGRLALPPGVPSQRIVLAARSLALERDWPSPPSRAQTSADASGRFELDRLYPGRTELTALLAGCDRPLLVREIELAPGKNDLGLLEPTALPRALRVAVRDAEGAPVPRGLALVTEAGATRRCAFAAGELTLLALELPVEVELRAEGFLSARIPQLTEDAEIELERGPRVTLRLDEGVVLPPPLELELLLVPLDEDEDPWGTEVVLPDGVTLAPLALWRDGAFAVFDARRELVLHAETGALRVLWTLRTPDPEGGYRRVRDIEGREPLLRIDTADRFTVAPGQDALDRARRVLERAE